MSNGTGVVLMRVHPTPLPAPLAIPGERSGATIAALRYAHIDAPGTDALHAAYRDPDLLLVTTGQQAGLFTGPLYTIHKALSAAALADHLARRWHRPVLPLFWVAGDDHDFAEAAGASWVDGESGALHEVRLPARAAEAPMRPMYREPLGPALDSIRGEFLNALPDAPHRDAVGEWISRHYRADATIAGAYGRALAEVLAPLGIACLDSTHPTFKRAAAPVLLRALSHAEALDAALAAVGATYAARGVAAPVLVGDGATLVFLEDRMGRDRLVREGDGFATRRGGDHYDLKALQAIAAAEPERLSASVLLRPVLESALLPTVAYVGGPGELRYLEMTGPIYEDLEVFRQTPVPRWSGILVEPHIDRLLEKFDTSVSDLLAAPAALERRLLRDHLPTEVADGLAELQHQANRIHDSIEAATLAIDPTLAGPMANSRRQMLWAARDLETRVLRRLRAREGVELAQTARIIGTLLPGGSPQERVLTLAPFLARHGPPLLQAIRTAADEWYASALEGAGAPA